MPIRGETIGTAYVKILADGGGLDRSIREEFRDSDGAFQQLGRRHSEAYQEGFDEQNESLTPKMIRGLEAGIRRNSGRFDAIGKQIGDDLFDPLDVQFRHRFGDLVGKQMSKDLREAFFRSGGASDTVDEFVEHLEANWEKATRTVDRETHEVEKLLRAQQKRLTEIEDDGARARASSRREEFLSIIHRIDTEVKAQEEVDRVVKRSAKIRAEIEQQTQRDIAKTRTEFRDLIRQINEFHKSTDADHATRKRLIDDLGNLRDRMHSLTDDTRTFDRDFESVGTRLRRTHPLLSRITNSFDEFSNGVARAFGKGSRNNFFNFFGSLIGGFTSLPGVLARGAQKLFDFADVFKVAFDKGGVLGVLKKLGGSVALATAGLLTLGVVMGGVVVITGILSSALLSLVGAATALAGSLAFALGGAIAIVAAGLLPLAAGIGVAVLAFKNMTKDQTKAFTELKKHFKDLGKDAAKNIFDSPIQDAKAFEGALKSLEAVTGPVSKALGGLLDEFVGSLSSPAFSNFVAFLGKTIPDMVTSLGHIFGNLLVAFQGFFIAVAPFLQEFLDWLGTVTADFADWTNSVKGQNAIADFMDKATESAKSIGGFILNLIELFGRLFDVGKKEGDSLFSSLSSTLQDWIDKLVIAAQDGTLKKWFKDAGDTASKIGEMVTQIGKFIEKLDTPENRQLVRDLASAFDNLLKAVAAVTPVLELMFLAIINPGKAGEKIIGKIGDAFQGLGKSMKAIYNSVIGPVLSTLLHALGDVLEAIADMLDALSHVPGFGWVKNLADDLHTAAGRADTLAESVRNIPDKEVHVNVLVPSQATIDKVNHQLGLIHGRVDVAIVPHAPDSGTGGSGGGGGGGGGSGSQRITTINVTTNTSDPRAVAAELMNALAASAYA